MNWTWRQHWVQWLARSEDDAPWPTELCQRRCALQEAPIGRARAPRANAICERVFGTMRSKCLDRMLILMPMVWHPGA